MSVDLRNLQVVVFPCIASGGKFQLYGNIIGEPDQTYSANELWISDISAVFHNFHKTLVQKVHVHHSFKKYVSPKIGLSTYMPTTVQMYNGQVREKIRQPKSMAIGVHSNCPCLR